MKGIGSTRYLTLYQGATDGCVVLGKGCHFLVMIGVEVTLWVPFVL